MVKSKQTSAMTGTKKKPLAKATAAKKTASRKPRAVRDTSPELRHRMISEAAYYIAEQRGFAGGDSTQDWLEAEKQIDGL